MAFKMKGMNHGSRTGSAYKNVSKTKYGEASAAFQKEKSPVERYNELKNKKDITREERQELDNLMKDEKIKRYFNHDNETDLYNQLNPNNPDKD
jgi:multidrug resistance efflux pump